MAKKAGEETLKTSLSEGTQEYLKKNKIVMSRGEHTVGKKTGKSKYKKPADKLYRTDGYDILENQIVVRHYFCRKYKLDLNFLEILLYLVPKDFFTWDDYYEMPKNFKWNRIGKMELMGYLKIAHKARTRKTSLFTTTEKARIMVHSYYKYLSGEKPMSLVNSPLLEKNSTAIDKMRGNLIFKLNKAGTPETKKRYFE